MYSLGILSGLLHKMMRWIHVIYTMLTLGDGYFMPIKHYNPVDEESLLAKYCPEKVKKPVSKGKGKGGKGSNST